MVTGECKPSAAVTVALAVNVLVLLFALVRLFADYSLMRWLYFTVSILFFAVADIYDDLCREFSATIMFIMSTLTALKVVF